MYLHTYYVVLCLQITNIFGFPLNTLGYGGVWYQTTALTTTIKDMMTISVTDGSTDSSVILPAASPFLLTKLIVNTVIIFNIVMAFDYKIRVDRYRRYGRPILKE